MKCEMLFYTVLTTIFPLVWSVTKQTEFARLQSAQNLVFSDHLLFQSAVPSRLSCSVLCAGTKCCERFTYTRVSPGTCRGYLYLLSSELGTSTPGAVTFVSAADRGARSNVALNKPTSQTSTWLDFYASRAVDGDLNTDLFYGVGCTHTEDVTNTDLNWWQVDLGNDTCGYGHDIVSVIITNRADCCSSRLSAFDVYVYADNPASNPTVAGSLCYHYPGQMGAGVTEELPCTGGPIRGRFVRVTKTGILTLCEVQVMATQPAN